MPKLSIIVPVYKTEKYLERCVTSLRNQTLRDIEIILVDDGSPDDCPQLCDAFAATDERIRVIHKPNGGVSTARNTGLDAAQGTYITFVDSDDFIELDMYEKMLAVAEEYDCDVVMCDCVKDFVDHSEVYSHSIRSGFYDEAQLREEYYPHLLMMENVEYPATISNVTILWRSTLNTPKQRYPVGVRYSEDLLFGAMLLRRAKSFYYMKGEALYHYIMNPTSASHTFVADKWQDYKVLYGKLCEAFGNNDAYDFSVQLDKCLLFFLYNTIGEIYGAAWDEKEKRQRIRAILSSPEVREMFRRVKVGRLPVPVKQRMITLLYKYRVGTGLLIKYYEKK
ncbi:MAG: glycosyltransferase [Clostridia bacterium]|nr:glycosyltransferase [Clostridia bacterium]